MGLRLGNGPVSLTYEGLCSGEQRSFFLRRRYSSSAAGRAVGARQPQLRVSDGPLEFERGVAAEVAQEAHACRCQHATCCLAMRCSMSTRGISAVYRSNAVAHYRSEAFAPPTSMGQRGRSLGALLNRDDRTSAPRPDSGPRDDRRAGAASGADCAALPHREPTLSCAPRCAPARAETELGLRRAGVDHDEGS